MFGIIVDFGLEILDVFVLVFDIIVVVGDLLDFFDDSDGSIDYGEEDEVVEKFFVIFDGVVDVFFDNDEYVRSFDLFVDFQSLSSEVGVGEFQFDVLEVVVFNFMND